MKINRSLKFVADNGNEIFLYDQKMISGQFWVNRPPRSVYSVLWAAWTTIQSGSTVEEVIKHLKSIGISDKAAKWAARKADEHHASRMGFMKFTDHYQGASEDERQIGD